MFIPKFLFVARLCKLLIQLWFQWISRQYWWLDSLKKNYSHLFCWQTSANLSSCSRKTRICLQISALLLFFFFRLYSKSWLTLLTFFRFTVHCQKRSFCPNNDFLCQNTFFLAKITVRRRKTNFLCRKCLFRRNTTFLLEVCTSSGLALGSKPGLWAGLGPTNIYYSRVRVGYGL